MLGVMKLFRFLGLAALALAAFSMTVAQSSEDLVAPEGFPATVDGLVGLEALEWVIDDCANRWTPNGSLSLCVVHDCETLYFMLTTSYYDIERDPLFVAFDLDRDGQAFAPGDLAVTSAGGFVTFSDAAKPLAIEDAPGAYALETQPQTGELQLEAAIPLAALGLAPGEQIPYTFGQDAFPSVEATLAALLVKECGGPTPEFSTPMPWPTEFTHEMLMEQLRAEQEAQQAQQRNQVLTVLVLALVAVVFVGSVVVLLGRRRR